MQVLTGQFKNWSMRDGGTHQYCTCLELNKHVHRYKVSNRRLQFKSSNVVNSNWNYIDWNNNNSFYFVYCQQMKRLHITWAVVSQLYGSTTVVMAIYGLHWKWRSLTPCQRHPSEPIEKIFGTIDYVIDLNNLAKFGFGKIFRDWGTYTQHIRFCAFFYFF